LLLLEIEIRTFWVCAISGVLGQKAMLRKQTNAVNCEYWDRDGLFMISAGSYPRDSNIVSQANGVKNNLQLDEAVYKQGLFA
jgi:hypothetical protein